MTADTNAPRPVDEIEAALSEVRQRANADGRWDIDDAVQGFTDREYLLNLADTLIAELRAARAEIEALRDRAARLQLSNGSYFRALQSMNPTSDETPAETDRLDALYGAEVAVTQYKIRLNRNYPYDEYLDDSDDNQYSQEIAISLIETFLKAHYPGNWKRNGTLNQWIPVTNQHDGLHWNMSLATMSAVYSEVPVKPASTWSSDVPTETGWCWFYGRYEGAGPSNLISVRVATWPNGDVAYLVGGDLIVSPKDFSGLWQRAVPPALPDGGR